MAIITVCHVSHRKVKWSAVMTSTTMKVTPDDAREIPQILAQMSDNLGRFDSESRELGVKVLTFGDMQRVVDGAATIRKDYVSRSRVGGLHNLPSDTSPKVGDPCSANGDCLPGMACDNNARRCMAGGKRADVFTEWQGKWVILSGTGDLANLRG
jgi:hypothetical protein